MTRIRVTIFLILTTLLAANGQQWAFVKVPVGTFRVSPAQGSELATQAVLGTPVKVVRSQGDWVRGELPDGTERWCNESALQPVPTDTMMAWRADPRRYIVTSAHEVLTYADSASSRPRDIVTELVNGSIVVADTVCGSRLRSRLPDGRICYIDTAAVTRLTDWVKEPFDIDTLMDMAYSMMGRPYLWGGVSTKMADCSGYTLTCYRHAAKIMLPRNSYAQARIGLRIVNPDHLQRGDLVFFTSPKTGHVNHVGIYDADGYFIHSSGRVQLNHISADHPDTSGKRFSHGVRLFDPDGLPLGRFRYIKNHPWYFGQKSVTLPNNSTPEQQPDNTVAQPEVTIDAEDEID